MTEPAEARGPSARLRVAVFDAFWATAGGGESYAAGVAEALSVDHEVTLLAHEPVDLAWLGERLGFDLSRVAVDVIDATAPLEEATRTFDLLVNLSYRDHGRSGARHGLYVVHFPDRPGATMATWQRALGALGRPLRRSPELVHRIRGFHPPDLIRWQEVRWTDGHGVLRIDLPPGRSETLSIWLGRYVPGGAARPVEVFVDGEVAAQAVLEAPRSKLEVIEPLRIDVPVSARAGGSTVEIRSESVIAHDVIGNGDRRRLGVPVVALSVRRSPVSLAARASLLTAPPPGTAWLDSYDVVVANSGYTRRWITKWWGRSSVILEPPVRLREAGAKEPIILSVGRFFAPGRGHAKKQAELVAAFSALRATGRADGWELHLVGGCDEADAEYLETVRRAAVGLPVVFHVDATGSELEALYARASIYWHAAGMGEDLDADPVRAEHFGISVVEAMSAGAVPIVYAEGGPVDVVRPDRGEGRWFSDLDQLVDITAELLGDPGARDEMGQAARRRAREFGRERFAGRLRDLVERVVGGEPVIDL